MFLDLIFLPFKLLQSCASVTHYVGLEVSRVLDHWLFYWAPIDLLVNIWKIWSYTAVWYIVIGTLWCVVRGIWEDLTSRDHKDCPEGYFIETAMISYYPFRGRYGRWELSECIEYYECPPRPPTITQRVADWVTDWMRSICDRLDFLFLHSCVVENLVLYDVEEAQWKQRIVAYVAPSSSKQYVVRAVTGCILCLLKSPSKFVDQLRQWWVREVTAVRFVTGQSVYNVPNEQWETKLQFCLPDAVAWLWCFFNLVTLGILKRSIDDASDLLQLCHTYCTGIVTVESVPIEHLPAPNSQWPPSPTTFFVSSRHPLPSGLPFTTDLLFIPSFVGNLDISESLLEQITAEKAQAEIEDDRSSKRSRKRKPSKHRETEICTYTKEQFVSEVQRGVLMFHANNYIEAVAAFESAETMRIATPNIMSQLDKQRDVLPYLYMCASVLLLSNNTDRLSQTIARLVSELEQLLSELYNHNFPLLYLLRAKRALAVNSYSQATTECQRGLDQLHCVQAANFVSVVPVIKYPFSINLPRNKKIIPESRKEELEKRLEQLLDDVSSRARSRNRPAARAN